MPAPGTPPPGSRAPGASAPGTREPSLAAAMDSNRVAHACHLVRRLRGASVADLGDLVVADSGLDDATFNVVALARFTAEGAGVRLVEVLRALRATGRPFLWWLGPTSTPEDLGERLTTAGLPGSAADPALWRPLAELPALAAPDGLTVCTVRDHAALAEFGELVAADWDPPSTTVRHLFAATAGWALAPTSPARYLVGRVDGQPVACAEVFVEGEVAGVYSVCTRADARRRGYGAALTVAALHAAREWGARTAVLQASAAGASLYRRLGFRPLGWVSQYAVLP